MHHPTRAPQIRINHEHQVIMSRRRAPCLDAYLDKVNMMLWPRFKVVFDAHLASVRGASERTLVGDDLQGHYVTRRYAEFAASAHSLAGVNGDGQLDQNMARRRLLGAHRMRPCARLTRHAARAPRRSGCVPRSATSSCGWPSFWGSARGSSYS